MRKNLFPVLIFITLFCIGLTILFIQQLHTDVLFFLYWTEKVVRGSKLYVDIRDMNTPLTYYFNYPVIKTAHFLGLSLPFAFKIYVLNILMIIILLCKKILSYSLASYREQIGLLFILILLFIFSGWDFGQREYLFSLLATPYVIARILYLSQNNLKTPSWLGIIVGLLAACSIGFKPYFILPLMGLEIFIFFVKKKKLTSLCRLENVSLMFFITFQIGIILWFLPGYPENFLIGLQTYSYFKTNEYIFLRYDTLLLIVNLLVFFYYYRKQAVNIVDKALRTLIIGSWISVVVQYKGFPQHYLPMMLVVLLYFSYSTYRLVINKSYAKINLIDKSVVCILITFIIFTLLRQELKALYPLLSVRNNEYMNLVTLTKENAENQKIAILSTSLYPTALLEHDAGVEWATRYPNFWILPGLYKNVNSDTKPYPYHSPSDMNKYEKDFFYTVIEDISLNNPKLIFIATGRYKHGLGLTTFDFYEYFSQDPTFSALISQYKLLSRKFGYDIFVIDEK